VSYFLLGNAKRECFKKPSVNFVFVFVFVAIEAINQNQSACRTPDCPAGSAVLIAPVSSQTPCKQGILQGKSRFQASRRKF